MVPDPVGSEVFVLHLIPNESLRTVSAQKMFDQFVAEIKTASYSYLCEEVWRRIYRHIRARVRRDRRDYHQ